MKRKLIVTLAFLLLIISLSFTAQAAEKTQLMVNGDIVPASDLYFVNGVSMLPVDAYIRLAGADLLWLSSNEFTIIENGITMNLTIGKKEAMLGDISVLLPVEPFKTSEHIYIPLRTVSDAFGFEVGWDEGQRVITLTRSETRNGMTIYDLLIKSSLATQTYNTFSMEGLLNTDSNINVNGKVIDQKLSTKVTGQVQFEPLQIYFKESVSGENLLRDLVVEGYINQDKIYIKHSGKDWIASDMPLLQELFQLQQDIQSDPSKALSLFKEMGLCLSLGNDLTLNGNDYYVVNATLNANKYKDFFDSILLQSMQGMKLNATSGISLETKEMDFNYSYLINKKTLILDIMKMDGKLRITMAVPVSLKTDAGEKEALPVEIDMDIRINGDVKFTGVNVPFKSPDISVAKEQKFL